jgi:hypothetical protein
MRRKLSGKSRRIFTTLVASLAILLAAPGSVLAGGAEPDDSAAGATALGTVGAEGETVSHASNLGYPGDIDWFSFSVEDPAGEIVVFSDPTKKLRLVVYDEKLEYIDSAVGLLFLKAEAGDYFLRVDSLDLEVGDYSIALGSVIEAEPNDCIADGNDLGLLAEMTVVSGSIEPMGDTDYFLFEVGPQMEGYATITAVATPGIEDDFDDGDLYSLWEVEETISLVLYAFDEEEGYRPIDHADGDIEADLKAGRYALRAESESLEPISGYILAISFPDIECDDEPNDSPEEALDIGVLTSGVELTISGCILPGGDVDYYAVVVEEPLDLVIETSGSGDGDSILSLYDGQKEEIARDDDGGEGTWSRIAELLEPGTYYLKVEAYGGGTFIYDLSVAQA